MPHDRHGTLTFQMGCFVVAEFLLTSVLRGSSAIAELLVLHKDQYLAICKRLFSSNSNCITKYTL